MLYENQENTEEIPKATRILETALKNTKAAEDESGLSIEGCFRILHALKV